MNRRSFLLSSFACLLAACGSAPNATPTDNVAATQTRAAELGQLATLTAPTTVAPTATPLAVATQTRVAELSQLATLTAPTAAPPSATTRPASPTAVPTALGRGSLVGRLDDPNAFVGLVVTNTEVVAYVCDGENLAQWFTGAMQGDRLDLSAAGGARLTAEVRRPATGSTDLQAASGTFQNAEGRALNFSTSAALGRAGLFRGTGTAGNTSLTMGVVVLDERNLRGILRAGQFLLPVTDPTFAANGLIATFAEFGPVTAQRLGT